ncbi:DUF6220 domain-containing protein [Microvirga arsenatis]|uniref:Uncharacterized protein n=1 Tax=Microvirga arsenatis TaxID=2692265 RepID=A0ABW9YYW7_9HYPH|nr:DUF6220 domain-containing protein [Microvirga arsenatis]NBJ11316.1 hypothetical protein [Microvirga arsenatis]NBJ25589.1 hypothetical protein [Microvirga arsenatis]
MQTLAHRSRPGLFPVVVFGITSIIPLLIVTQFFLVGLGIFVDGAMWELHGALGGFIALPVGTMLLIALFSTNMRRLRGLSLLVFLLYALQIAWLVIGEATGIGALRAAHAANAALLLLASAMLAYRSSKI